MTCGRIVDLGVRDVRDLTRLEENTREGVSIVQSKIPRLDELEKRVAELQEQIIELRELIAKQSQVIRALRDLS